MKNGTTVHRWKSKSEYFDIADGVEISKAVAKRDYITIKTHKNVTIENFEGTITYIHECRKKTQLKLRI